MSEKSLKIISVQDISCYGQCSTSVALPVLASWGIETAILPSAILSTHTGGFPGYISLDLTDQMPKIVEHWKAVGLSFDAIYTGYIGDARQFETILDAKNSLLKEGGILVTDPAMADHGKLYKALGPEIVEGMKQLAACADVILPNLTETAMLLGQEYREDYSKEELCQLAKQLTGLGPQTAIITGASLAEDSIGAIAYDRRKNEYTICQVAKCSRAYHGTGDIFASVVVAEYLKGNPMEQVLQSACEFTAECISVTMDDESHGYGVKLEQVLNHHRM